MRVEEGWLWVERVDYADIPHTVDTALSVSQMTGGGKIDFCDQFIALPPYL